MQVNVTDGPGCAVTFAPAVVVLPPAVAVTVVSALVVSCTRAWPLASVTAVVLLNVPRSAENVTGTPDTARPPVPMTDAVTSTVPPFADTIDGFAEIVMVSTAAAPIVICTTLADVLVVAVVPVPVDGAVEPPAAGGAGLRAHLGDTRRVTGEERRRRQAVVGLDFDRIDTPEIGGEAHRRAVLHGRACRLDHVGGDLGRAADWQRPCRCRDRNTRIGRRQQGRLVTGGQRRRHQGDYVPGPVPNGS